AAWQRDPARVSAMSLTRILARLHALLTTRSCAHSGRGSDHDLRRDLALITRDKTDADNRGVNDPGAAARSVFAIDDGGRSRPEYLPIFVVPLSSGRQKAPPLL